MNILIAGRKEKPRYRAKIARVTPLVIVHTEKNLTVIFCEEREGCCEISARGGVKSQNLITRHPHESEFWV